MHTASPAIAASAATATSIFACAGFLIASHLVFYCNELRDFVENNLLS